MAKDSLEIASKFLRLRQYDKAIKLLESRSEIYENNFDYYMLLGNSFLYVGDYGGASSYYQKARTIKLTDTNLLLGQAALFLRRGDTDRAINYYIEVLENDPSNAIAKNAMNFIKNKGDFNTICKWVDTGKIEQFYPPIGFNPNKIWNVLIPVFACFLGCLLVFAFNFSKKSHLQERADLSDLVLSVEEKKSLQETNLSSGSFAYILTSKQIEDSYNKAMDYFQEGRDNLTQIEINRLLNSNAAVSVKQKSRLLMNYLEIPSFDSLKDNVNYKNVQNEIALYLDCWVIWSGRISNVVQTDSNYSCDFLVGYESMENLEGIVPVKFDVAPVLDVEKPVRILAKITSENGKLCLLGRAVYQSVKE